MTSSDRTSAFDLLKSKLRDTWSSGDFGQIGRAHANGNLEFVERLSLKPGTKVLDVACGTGTSSIPAARTGAEVTGIDIAANLIAQAIENADREGVKAKFEVGDAEDLPYADNSFDMVITMFGAMFAPRPDVTTKELIRVAKSGGLIAMANWTPDSFIGQTFKLYAKYLPPPPAVPPPILWGKEDVVRDRFSFGVSDLQFAQRKLFFEFPFGPSEVVDHFRKYFGPAQNVFDSLNDVVKNDLRRELVELWASNNVATDGTTMVESEYLEIRAKKA